MSMDIIQGGQGLKAELAAKIADAERRDQADPRLYDGYEWWQLSDAEREVFDIHPADWPRMMLAWHCFECFTGTGDSGEFSDTVLDAARAAYPEWFEAKDRGRHFLAFAQVVADLSNRAAFAVMRKMEAAELRDGVLEFGDGT